MIDNFANCLAVTLKEEGGYSNNPNDPGGATMRGVTQRVYDAYRHSIGAVARPVRVIADSEVQDIYRQQYWNSIKGDDLPKGIDLAVFDWAVNSGIYRASLGLQAVANVAQDGHIGLVTLGAVNAISDRASAISAISARRLSFLEQLRQWRFFNADWKRRVGTISAAAKLMASAS